MNNDGIIRLWQSVVITALNDSVISKNTKYNKYKVNDMKIARDWLLNNETSFYTICYWANIDPISLRNKVKKLFTRHDNNYSEDLDNNFLNKKFLNRKISNQTN